MNNFILKNENAVFYECGYSCDNEIFLSLSGEKFLLSDARYTIEAREFAKNTNIIECDCALYLKAKEILKSKNIKEIFFDPCDFSYYEFCQLSKDLNINFIPKLNFSKIKRMIKSSKEIELLKNSAKLGAKCFDEFAKFINENEGLSEKELFFNASRILLQNGSCELSFSPIFAINENSAKAHALPSEKKLKIDDLVLFDAGVKLNRYCSDRTRMGYFDTNLSFSKVPNFKNQKQNEIFHIVKEAKDLAIKSIKPGVKACEIDKIARDFITKAGFGDKFFHSTGHGVGLDIHELPLISKKDETILAPGMVFSIEPGIYLENEFGIRIEDVVVVNENGCEIL